MTLWEARSVEVAGDTLAFQLRRSDRRTLAVTVEPDLRILVTAPRSAPEDRIADVIRKRVRWIRRQQRVFTELPAPTRPRQWISGETHRYLGRQYRLRVSRTNHAAVRLRPPHLEVMLPRPGDNAAVERAVQQWYQGRARAVLEKRLTHCLEATTWLRVPRPQIVIRVMWLRWGSCTPSGRLLLNRDLVKLSTPCIDYVLTHELCHLKVPNHGRKFARLLERCMPDWERWRRALDKAEI